MLTQCGLVNLLDDLEMQRYHGIKIRISLHICTQIIRAKIYENGMMESYHRNS